MFLQMGKRGGGVKGGEAGREGEVGRDRKRECVQNSPKMQHIWPCGDTPGEQLMERFDVRLNVVVSDVHVSYRCSLVVTCWT